MADRHVVIIGAGIGGLACAARLAAAGCRVTLIEARPTVGGKMRQLPVGGLAIDSGPTVFTMRWVFEELFASCGADLAQAVSLTKLDVLARHAWPDGARLDLFADLPRSADAIGQFAGAAAARGFLAFSTRAARTYAALEHSFIRASRPTPLSLMRDTGLAGLTRISPFSTLWSELGKHFRDPRLQQLFGRYATYNGSSPFTAPATLMLIAHVEQQGVWAIAGGMHGLAEAVWQLAERHGARLLTGRAVSRIMAGGGGARGVTLDDGEHILADAVVMAADVAALPSLLGTKPEKPQPRSLSAMTWSIAGSPSGFQLLHHTVFFSSDYQAEFDDIAKGRMPARPTVYICAPDRPEHGAPPPAPERLFCIMNAPAIGDRHPFTAAEIAASHAAMHRLFESCGLEIACRAEQVTTPTDFATLFPATGGALYGAATHGAMASFRRPGARTKLPNLYLAGGSVHPGAGVPMAALSGAVAAASLLADGASTGQSRPAATAGGTSTR